MPDERYQFGQAGKAQYLSDPAPAPPLPSPPPSPILDLARLFLERYPDLADEDRKLVRTVLWQAANPIWVVEPTDLVDGGSGDGDIASSGTTACPAPPVDDVQTFLNTTGWEDIIRQARADREGGHP